MNETFTKLKFVYSLGVLITTLLALGLIRINLVQTSADSMMQFTRSNYYEIAHSDTLTLATKLNALLASENVICIFGAYKGEEFVNFRKGSCHSSVMVSESVYRSGNDGDIEIKLSFRIPNYLLFSTLSFILGEMVLFLYLFHLNRQRILLNEKIKDLTINISRQVAHDIRSPLTALNLAVSTFQDMTAEKRQLVKNATQRINDIANDLLKKNTHSFTTFADLKKDTAHILEGTSVILLPTLIDRIVSEKRIQYREKIDIKIEADLNNSFGTFILGNDSELSRIISNLLNNSVEALNNDKGEISVSLSGTHNRVLITIRDNGKGIPETLLPYVGELGFSHGKAGIESGSGLGIHHAKNTVYRWGGNFKIKSKLNEGVSVEMEFPRVASPDWFAGEIRLKSGTKIVSVDDDMSIHQIWKERLKSIDTLRSNLSLKSFTSPKDFLSYPIDDNMFFLIDYEFLNQNRSGLDLIKARNIWKRSVLVTSRFDETKIQLECKQLQIKLLPKQMLGFVPIEVDAPKAKLDYCLIDDDELVHMAWQINAKALNHKMRSYRNIEVLFNDLSSLDPLTKIYIDSNLGEDSTGAEVKGESIAKQLFDKNFHNLYITSGYSPEQFANYSFLKGVVGKEPPKL
ncbi:MAG: HAMP domain-containing histidine kinase [Bdellovibrionaceae bacterium]|nr:HAMP domain-containing histidine kinase [Pseudobdellovibrionaceae bacterium]